MRPGRDHHHRRVRHRQVRRHHRLRLHHRVPLHHQVPPHHQVLLHLLPAAPASDGFACAYDTGGECPAYKFFATKGEQYAVLVYNEGKCASGTAEYKILVDASADPVLTQEAEDAKALT